MQDKYMGTLGLAPKHKYLSKPKDYTAIRKKTGGNFGLMGVTKRTKVNGLPGSAHQKKGEPIGSPFVLHPVRYATIGNVY